MNSELGRFYTKIAMAGFVLGAGMEFFMIQTGFYDKVVEIEAGRIEEQKYEKQEFLNKLKNYVEEEKKKRGP